MAVELTSQIISADTFNVFLYTVSAGGILGLVIAALVKSTIWLWR